MSTSLSRAARRSAVLCLVISIGTVFVSRAAAGTEAHEHEDANRPERATLATERTSFDGATRGHYSSTATRLRVEALPGGTPTTVLAFAPAKNAPSRPLTVVYLHGVNGRAENGCPWLRAGASELGWLVCPEAVMRAENGTASWGGDVFKQGAVVARAIHAAEANGAAGEPGVAVGFSQGSYVALDLVKTGLRRFRGLVLIAAPEAHPSARKLRDAGVARVALAAGSLDAAYAPLVLDARRLEREGIEARFFDLGHVGHTYAAEDTMMLREAITWAGGIE